MAISYNDLLSFVQHFAPTWRKIQHVNLALLLSSLLECQTLCLSDLARAYPSPTQPLHGRLKRLMCFLDNPNLDEAALFLRFLKLAYRFGENLPNAHTILPIIIDTTYFGPFALLVASVPCGSRALPVAFTTYHRRQLKACFPPKHSRPRPNENPFPLRPEREHRNPPSASLPTSFPSQNQIEEELIDYLFDLISSALRPVLVADCGFARASLFLSLQAKGRDFVIRVDAQTHVHIQSDDGQYVEKELSSLIKLQPGERKWYPNAFYTRDQKVAVNILAVWDKGQREPWYLATSLRDPAQVESMYRWRMRLECTNRDKKTGVLLRRSGDKHAIRSLMHMHRLLLVLAVAEWLCALTGLEAHRELSASDEDDGSSESMHMPNKEQQEENKTNEDGPSLPPPVVPHRGARSRLPNWKRPFAVRGDLSYVRVGFEVLRTAGFVEIVRRLLCWLEDYLWLWTPPWRPYQIRYRLKHWWHAEEKQRAAVLA